MKTTRLAIASLLVPLAALVAPLTGSAQMLPGQHPGYLHALTDLRAARWFLYHQPGDSRVAGDEDIAITEIDATINEIRRASIDDGKNLNDHPNVDAGEHGSRLLKSLETLQIARADLDQEEDNPQVRELRHRAVAHIDRALKAAGKAHAEWLGDVRG